MKPTNAQVTALLFMPISQLARPESPTKPIRPPSTKKNNRTPSVFSALKGWDSRLMMGLYIPNAAQSAPPLTPGRIAPKPTSTPLKINRMGSMNRLMVFDSLL